MIGQDQLATSSFVAPRPARWFNHRQVVAQEIGSFKSPRVLVAILSSSVISLCG
jgi:hypothetical protein